MALIWEKLSIAVDEGRLAQTILFSGPAGIGKRALALRLAQKLICQTKQACGQCGPCQRVLRGESESLTMVTGEPIKLEQVRPLREALALRNWHGARVVVIDPADQLNPQSANALLKILEEPPEDTYFFLVSANVTQILPTIRSRSQLVRVLPEAYEELGNELVDDELMKSSVGWWLDVAGGSRAPRDESWRETIRERDSALKCIELWSVLLFRARRAASGLPLKASEDSKLIESLKVKPLAIDQIWRDLLELKGDIESQVDRGLAMDSFWLKTRENLR